MPADSDATQLDPSDEAVVTEHTFEQNQTGKIHFINVNIGSFYKCFCRVNRSNKEPDVRTVHLKEERVCRTCARQLCESELENTPDIDYDEIDAPADEDVAAISEAVTDVEPKRTVA